MIAVFAIVSALLMPRMAPAASARPIAGSQPVEETKKVRDARAAEREQLRQKLQALRRAIAASEVSRSEVADALAGSERSISDSNRQLRELDQKQAQVQAELGAIGERRVTTQSHLSEQQTRLAELLHRQYLAGGQEPFKLLFSGSDPNLIQRDLMYLGYLARAEASVLRSLRANLDELGQIAEDTEKRQAELARIAQERQKQRASLLKEQQKRRQLLASISVKLRTQQREAGALERDEKRLARVVQELAKVIERQARAREQARRQERDRPKTASRDAGKPASTPDRRSPAPKAGIAVQSSADEGVYGNFDGSFAKLKGRLRLPIRGELMARFGSSRQDGGPSWKGLFIRAPQGSEVKAVAPGRIIFAEWLRGFGNLLIVDHGDQYLSIYGNNESLFKQPGDVVQTGETLAAVGNTGGNQETGLYFELRFAGRPFDPLSWATLR